MTDVVVDEPRTNDDPPPGRPVSRGVLIATAAGLVAVGVLSVAFGKGSYALGALGFVVALLISVTLHEGGHFLTARRYGMKATQFFVGFGPTLWSRQTGETEWGVKAIPAGGFVKIVGMTSLEEIDPKDEDRAFYKQPAGQRAVVLAAGSTVHFILAVLIVLLSALTIGKAVETSPDIGAISECVPAAAQGTCQDAGSVAPPARDAGLQVGDTVVSVGGTPTGDRLQFIQAIRGYPGRPVEVVVERDGAQRAVTLTPVAVQRESLTVEGQIDTVGAIGVAPQGRQGTERLGPVEAVGHSVDEMGRIVTGIWTTFSEKVGTITQVYGEDRDPEGFIGVVGATRISGEVIASEETAGFKLLRFLGLIAGLNFFVGVFNLLPLLPLDGGHIAVLAYEQARDRVKRLFGYRGPLLRVDLTKLLPLTYAVVLFFAGFTLWLLGADIVNPIRLNG
jgi:membrane-associated protease RseP (regulator of RpoE activity)